LVCARLAIALLIAALLIAALLIAVSLIAASLIAASLIAASLIAALLIALCFVWLTAARSMMVVVVHIYGTAVLMLMLMEHGACDTVFCVSLQWVVIHVFRNEFLFGWRFVVRARFLHLNKGGIVE
jgi:hypothetical protein